MSPTTALQLRTQHVNDNADRYITLINTDGLSFGYLVATVYSELEHCSWHTWAAVSRTVDIAWDNWSCQGAI